ncbi:unnamed protein product [Mytilus edulis]|uniref:Transglutaminase-like domain-containing protein n=1 Tax=Mytilus edulis TaxID=6550 RepID=A0A8S3TJI3_MYTED|nr:unnamed protein product [Mytilus edulis]
MGKKNNGNGNTRNKSTQDKSKSNDVIDGNTLDDSVSVIGAITEAHNVIYNDDETMFGHLFDNTQSQSNKLKRKLSTVSDSESESDSLKTTKQQKRTKNLQATVSGSAEGNKTKSVSNVITEAEVHMDSSISPDLRILSQMIIIRNLPESTNENIESKVSALFREGLKVQITPINCERKQSRSTHTKGVFIVSCKSKAVVNDVMSAKYKLKSSRQYSDVFIHRDQTVQQRIERKNFQTIVDVLKSVDPHINMKGAEVIASRYVNSRRSSENRSEHENRGTSHTQQNTSRRETNNSTRSNTSNLHSYYNTRTSHREQNNEHSCSYNVTAYFGGESAAREPIDVLKSKSSVCEGYARLFHALCVYRKDVKCQKISGFSKGYGHQLGTIISYQTKTDHAWNVVFVLGKWRFIETTWGAGSLDDQKTFVKKFSNFYFLTKPEHFIEDHFPYINNDAEGSKEWQLLKRPVSLEEFSKTLKTTKFAREWGVIFPSHKHEVVKVDRKASIPIESKQNTLVSVKVNLYNSNTELCNNSVVLVKDNGSKCTITIMPKEIGKYTLKVYGTIDQSQTGMPKLTEYMIDCTSTEDEFMPYPEHNRFYGPSNDCNIRGFANFDSIPAFQICKNGEFELKIKTNRTVKVSANIFETDGSRSSDFVMIEQSNDSVCVKARFINKGYYKLTIFSELEGNDKHSEAMNILVLNKVGAKFSTPFPKTYSSTKEYNCHLIEPLVRNIPSNSNVRFVMSSPVIEQILIDGKVYKKENSETWDVTLKTGDPGEVKVSAKTDINAKSFTSIYLFVVDSE